MLMARLNTAMMKNVPVQARNTRLISVSSIGAGVKRFKSRPPRGCHGALRMTAAVAHAKTRPDPLRATWIGARNLRARRRAAATFRRSSVRFGSREQRETFEHPQARRSLSIRNLRISSHEIEK